MTQTHVTFHSCEFVRKTSLFAYALMITKPRNMNKISNIRRMFISYAVPLNWIKSHSKLIIIINSIMVTYFSIRKSTFCCCSFKPITIEIHLGQNTDNSIIVSIPFPSYEIIQLLGFLFSSHLSASFYLIASYWLFLLLLSLGIFSLSLIYIARFNLSAV